MTSAMRRRPDVAASWRRKLPVVSLVQASWALLVMKVMNITTRVISSSSCRSEEGREEGLLLFLSIVLLFLNKYVTLL